MQKNAVSAPIVVVKANVSERRNLQPLLFEAIGENLQTVIRDLKVGGSSTFIAGEKTGIIFFLIAKLNN